MLIHDVQVTFWKLLHGISLPSVIY